MLRPAGLLVLLLAAAACGVPRAAQAQAPVDTTQVPDFGAFALPDTLQAPVQTTAGVGLTDRPTAPASNGRQRLEAPVQFTARDSLVIVFSDDEPDDDLGTLYGDAQTQYQEARLTAAEIDLLFRRETLRARGDATGAGTPSFQQGTDAFTGRELAYNLGTQRGRLVGARTQIDDGYILGGVVKQVGTRTTFAQDVVYTTCEYEEHQHWGLHVHRMKIVEGEWIYTGPAQLRILGIPTPVWLPFGFFPATPEGRRSGPLPLDYGEQTDLGFFVRNIGYYWALSEYLDLQLAGGFYTSGSYELNATTRYARRYWASGDLSVGFRNERRGERQDPTFVASNQASIRWTHQQTLDAAGTARLSGNVDLRSTGFDRTAQASYQNRVQQQTTSTLNFTKRWRSGRNVTLGYNQSLNLRDGSTTITLPSGTFSQPRIHPFRRSGSRGQAWYEQISVQYTNRFDNRYRFTPLADSLRPGAENVSWLDALLSPADFRAATGEDLRFTSSMNHRIPVAAQFNVARLPLIGAQLNLTPSLNYEEEWLFRRNAPVLREDGFIARDSTGRTLFEEVGGFNPRRLATLSISASTQAFGTFPWRVGRFDGLRHEIRPTASLSFRPDEGGAFWGRFERYTEPNGTEFVFPTTGTVPVTTRPGSTLVPGEVVDSELLDVIGPFVTPPRPNQTLNLSVNNVFRTRVVTEDTTGAIDRTPLQLATLGLTSGYNFSADSLRLQNVNLNLRSTLFDRLEVSYTAAFSPYAVDTLGQTINRLTARDAGIPLRFLRSSLSLTTRFQSGDTRGGSPDRPRVTAPPALPDLDPITGALYPYDFRRRDLAFVDFSIPWSLDLSFDYSLQRAFSPTLEDQRLATLNATFQLGLTPEWRLSGRTGYDFATGDIVSSQLSVLRDLHCWEMSIDWIPFGQVRAFSFSIYVKSGYLRDLLRLNVPNTDRTQFL